MIRWQRILPIGRCGGPALALIEAHLYPCRIAALGAYLAYPGSDDRSPDETKGIWSSRPAAIMAR